MKISFITTVFNEEKTIEKFLESLFAQSKLPDEIIIVDGGSTDGTVEKLKTYELRFKKKKVTFISLIKRGNRSVGRNEAIRRATGEIIACSDAGNILEKNWLKNITKPFFSHQVIKSSRHKTFDVRHEDMKTHVDVVSGYYDAKPKNIFQKCLLPYVFVMPDKIDPKNFLPATRSVAFTKAVWKKVGGFPKQFSHNEDYVFANRLQAIGAKIVFAKDAIVYWIPRDTLRQAFYMFYRFALGDAEAGIYRAKAQLLFARYFFALYLVFLSILYKSFAVIIGLAFLVGLYIFWSIKKNYRYINDKKAYYLLPVLQFTADAAVLSGTTIGIIKQIQKFNLWNGIKQNIVVVLILCLYTVLILVSLPFGTPNPNHPFPYHMDEWHQLMAIKAVIKEGTTTIPGAAQIPFVYPILSGVYLIPFVLFKVIDPFALDTPLDHLAMQQTLFEILRSINIFFGVGCMVILAYIAKKYFRINAIVSVYFFAFSPILLMLSGYFKYDIGLLFWIMLAILFLFRFIEVPRLTNYIYASLASALAFGTKFSAIPLLPLLLIAFFFAPKEKRNYSWLVIGCIVFVGTFLFIGSPNILMGTADYRELLYSNLVSGPRLTENYTFQDPWWMNLWIRQFPTTFGKFFYFLSIASFFYLVFLTISKKYREKIFLKHEVFLLVSFLWFWVSLFPLRFVSVGNRALVLLPFFALMTGVAFAKIPKQSNRFFRYGLLVLLFTVGLLHFTEATVWLYTKLQTDPQKEASLWVQKNIPNGQTIGIENIPIYQYLPNSIVKEFYQKEYNIQVKNKFKYQLIDCKTVRLPLFVVMSNDEIETKLLKSGPKKCLVQRLKKDNYERIASFSPNFTFYEQWYTKDDYYVSGIIPWPYSVSVYKKR